MPTSNPSHTLHRPAPPAETLDPQQELLRALELMNAGNLDEAERAYERILAAVPDHAETLHFKGLAAHQRGRHMLAIELLRQAIALDGGVFGWHSNLGNVLLLTGQGDAAADAYEQALSLAPERSDVHNNLGVLLGEQGRFEAAERTLRRAIELDPDSAEAHVNLARLLLRLTRASEALVCLEPVLRLRPDVPMAHRWMGMAYRMLGRLGEAAQAAR